MSEHTLLILSIGPVQDLIASARRCRDLWFGSWLLADAAREAAEHVAERARERGASNDGCDALVFPGAATKTDLSRDRRVANRILARLPVGLSDAEAIAIGAADAARARLRSLAEEAYDRVRERVAPILADHLHRDEAEAQVADLLDIQWVVVAEGEGGYAEALDRANALLAARKHSRVWDPPTWSKPVPKSSIDGFRESVIDERLYDDIARGRVAAKDAYDAFRIHASERLCGVGLLKRLGRDASDRSGADRFFSTSHLAARKFVDARAKRVESADRFFSTSHLAALPTLVGAAKHPHAAEAFGALRERLRDLFPDLVHHLFDVVPRPLPPFGRVDGAVLFDSRLVELVEELEGEAADLSAKLPEARKALRSFLKSLNLAEPLPYFAVLLADGDRMGRAIRTLGDFEAHRRLSRALSSFAEEARTIVESDAHHGSLVYSGGDDVLALLPLHSVLACADELRKGFAKRMEPLGLGDDTPTLSVGVAIGHHLTPLDATLNQARAAEALAKRERNSFALVVDKRSGPDLELTRPWSDALTARLRRFAAAHRDGQISDKAAFELMALEELAHPRSTQPGLEPVAQAKLDAVVAAETERVLRGKALDEGFLAELRALGLTAEPHELGRELVVARLFADAFDRADAPSEEKTP